MDPRRFLRGRNSPVSATAVAWTLLLLLLPPIACSGAVSPGAEAESELSQGDLIARLPAEVTTVGYIDFAAVRSSPIYDFFKREAGAAADPQQLEEIIAEAGIDPRTDLHRLAFVQHGAVIDTDPQSAGLVAVATFDRDRVEQALGQSGSEEYAGYTLYTLASWSRGEPSTATDDETDPATEESDPDQGEPDAEQEEAGAEDDSDRPRRGFVTILDDSTLAFGSADTIRQIVNVAQGAASARTNERLMGLLEDVDAGSQVWVVSAQDALFSQIKAPAGTPMPQIPIDKINALIVSIRLHEGLALTFRGRTDQEEDAELLGDSLNGMLAFGKMMLQSRSPEIFEILDRAISAGSSGRDVNVRADLSMADLEALSDYTKAMIKGEDAGEGKQVG